MRASARHRMESISSSLLVTMYVLNQIKGKGRFSAFKIIENVKDDFFLCLTVFYLKE